MTKTDSVLLDGGVEWKQPKRQYHPLKKETSGELKTCIYIDIILYVLYLHKICRIEWRIKSNYKKLKNGRCSIREAAEQAASQIEYRKNNEQ
jgi:hypothetical protein